MTDLVTAAHPASCEGRSNFAHPDFAGMACRLAFMLEEEIAALEIAGREPGYSPQYSEMRVKALIALTKTLQAMEDMVQKQQEKAKDEPADHRDIVEFRAAIARKLEALAAAGECEPADGDPDAGATDED
jgi:hypothetical protein